MLEYLRDAPVLGNAKDLAAIDSFMIFQLKDDVKSKYIQ
jgi:hypothetical protein